jgi:FtsH-binding integral membrane protein
LGFLVGPLINRIAAVRPEILIQAVCITMVMFATFSGMAIFSQRRSYLFLGGIIFSLCIVKLLYMLTSWMLGYSNNGLIFIIFSLFLACLFIIFDTQTIIEEAEDGDTDVPTHSLKLFLDLFDLFMSIIKGLLKKND